MKTGGIIGHLSDTPLKRGLWVITRPVWFQRPDGRVLEISPHFILDYASSPRWTWPIIPARDGEYDVAAAFHDYCVRNRKLLGYSLMECHAVFMEVLEAQRVARWKRNAMYAVVVAFNWMMAGKGDGTAPHIEKQLNQFDREIYEGIKTAFPWRVEIGVL
jgi:hypothetical protein